MPLDHEISKTNKGINDIRKKLDEINDRIPGLGLYIIVGVAMIAAIRSCNRTGDIKETLQSQVQYQDVIGQEAPERFYEINGQRIYLEVDGKPVEEYFR
ncbi:MAG: hypothetical protein AABX51_01890 [Nanoarchaeota archaeon]